MKTIKPQKKTGCSNEFSKLKRVIVCEPQYMTIQANINDIQRQFKETEFNAAKALRQHRELVRLFESYGIEVISFSPRQQFAEQVFTRDIGFTAGETVFIAEMAQQARIGEEKVLLNWLQSENLPHVNLSAGKIEGGDVLIHGRKLFIGLSDRTDKKAIDHLQELLPGYEIFSVPFTKKYLHLDCVFNIISETQALYFPQAFEETGRQLLADHFQLIEVTEAEQFTLGTNVLSLGDRKILTLPVNQGVNAALRERGYEVIELDISEIIKSGGSFRCCTLPVMRE